MNFNIASLVLTLTFLMISKVSAYAISQPLPSATKDNSKISYPTNILRLDMDEVYFHFDYLVKNLSFEELCDRIGGVILDNGDCHDEKRIVKPVAAQSVKSTKNLPSDYDEYRDIYAAMNSYPKTVSFERICRELHHGTMDDMGFCISTTVALPRQVSTTAVTMTTGGTPAQLTLSLPPIAMTESISIVPSAAPEENYRSPYAKAIPEKFFESNKKK